MYVYIYVSIDWLLHQFIIRMTRRPELTLGRA